MEREKINLKKKYPGVVDEPRYEVILYPSGLAPVYPGLHPYPSSVEINHERMAAKFSQSYGIHCTTGKLAVRLLRGP